MYEVERNEIKSVADGSVMEILKSFNSTTDIQENDYSIIDDDDAGDAVNAANDNVLMPNQSNQILHTRENGLLIKCPRSREHCNCTI